MSLVERTLELARNPKISFNEARAQWTEHNIQVKQFISGDTSLSELNEVTKGIINEENSIILNYPGTLYGLLVKIGLDKEEAKGISVGEKSHLWKAKQEGIRNTKFVIQFSSKEHGNTKNIELKTNDFRVFFWFELPNNLEDNATREIVRRILLEPEKLSEDDLAKIP